MPRCTPQGVHRQVQGTLRPGLEQGAGGDLQAAKGHGIIPPDTELPPPNPGIQPWGELTDAQKAVYARLQEVFAGFSTTPITTSGGWSMPSMPWASATTP